MQIKNGSGRRRRGFFKTKIASDLVWRKDSLSLFRCIISSSLSFHFVCFVFLFISCLSSSISSLLPYLTKRLTPGARKRSMKTKKIANIINSGVFASFSRVKRKWEEWDWERKERIYKHILIYIFASYLLPDAWLKWKKEDSFSRSQMKESTGLWEENREESDIEVYIVSKIRVELKQLDCETQKKLQSKKDFKSVPLNTLCKGLH